MESEEYLLGGHSNENEKKLFQRWKVTSRELQLLHHIFQNCLRSDTQKFNYFHLNWNFAAI